MLSSYYTEEVTRRRPSRTKNDYSSSSAVETSILARVERASKNNLSARGEMMGAQFAIYTNKEEFLLGDEVVYASNSFKVVDVIRRSGGGREFYTTLVG